MSSLSQAADAPHNRADASNADVAVASGEAVTDLQQLSESSDSSDTSDAPLSPPPAKKNQKKRKTAALSLSPEEDGDDTQPVKSHKGAKPAAAKDSSQPTSTRQPCRQTRSSRRQEGEGQEGEGLEALALTVGAGPSVADTATAAEGLGSQKQTEVSQLSLEPESPSQPAVHAVHGVHSSQPCTASAEMEGERVGAVHVLTQMSQMDGTAAPGSAAAAADTTETPKAVKRAGRTAKEPRFADVATIGQAADSAGVQADTGKAETGIATVLTPLHG